MSCIMFNAPKEIEALRKGSEVDLAAEAQLNEYNGYVSVQLRVEEIREAAGS